MPRSTTAKLRMALNSLVLSGSMDPATALSVSAEIAVTIAGFTGIIVVLQHKKATSEQTGRILNILLLCFLIIVVSLLPFALTAFGISEHYVWTIACGTLGISVLLYTVRGARAALRHELVPVNPWLFRGILIVFGVVGLMMLSIALGYPVQPSAAPVLSAVIMLILAAGYAFTATLIWALQDST